MSDDESDEKLLTPTLRTNNNSAITNLTYPYITILTIRFKEKNDYIMSLYKRIFNLRQGNIIFKEKLLRWQGEWSNAIIELQLEIARTFEFSKNQGIESFLEYED